MHLTLIRNTFEIKRKSYTAINFGEQGGKKKKNQVKTLQNSKYPRLENGLLEY